MFILKAFKDLTLMKKILYGELPQSINVLGGLLHILQNNVFQMKMCVDSWPTFSTAICYHQNQDLWTESGFGDINEKYSIFSKNQDTLRSLLADDKLVKWRNGFQFEGFHIKEHGVYHSYIYNSREKLELLEMSSKLSTTALNESDAELVDKQLPYGGSKESINLVRAYIKHLPSFCVVDEKGRPVSWLLTDEFNAARMGYTEPKYRRAGLAQNLMVKMIQQRTSEGLPVYGHVHEENLASIELMKGLGFTACEETAIMVLSNNCI
ncbi:glycine N-acyltransferase-like protein 3 isoform X2 [Corythoichthys intestinalis]|uniref:glycine N-acyltransferase-like protein 3 isoform X2 n=1 Tax=Corythoichthys intestinalis TaxID=161448 RepID=UPI0025A591D8|nr:glycine N-acyltransferase-like protein 3 isoform X2 [Corythoichthys intestinalis]